MTGQDANSLMVDFGWLASCQEREDFAPQDKERGRLKVAPICTALPLTYEEFRITKCAVIDKEHIV